MGKRTAASVDIVLNDETTVAATLGRPRPDVRVSLDEADAAVACGWMAAIDLSAWPVGDLRVDVIARSRSGAATAIGRRIYALQAEGFEGHLDEPREGTEIRGDLVVVRGWATVGHRPASRVEVSLNGRPAGRARLRVLRADVDRHSSGRLGPVTGFEYRGMLSSQQGPGLDVEVTVHSLDGSTVAVPLRHVHVVPRNDAAVEDGRTAALSARGHIPGARVAPRGGPRDGPSTEPRLLVFTHSLTLGGGQLYLSELLRQIKPALARCTVVSPVDGIVRTDIEDQGIEVTIIPEPQLRDFERYEGHIRERAMMIADSGCNIVLLNTLGPWSAGDAAMRAGVPFLWAIHESFELSDWIELNFGPDGLPAYVRRRMEATLAGAHKLIFEARATSEMFARFADAAHRAVVPYGVDTAGMAQFARQFDRDAARHARHIPLDATVLLAIGTLEERKSQACLVEAFTAVADEYTHVRLVLIGDHPSEYSEAIRRMITASGFADRISLLPITPSVWEWYAIADVLVSASDIESLPRSMLECMALGVPVVSTNVFGVPELVEDGVNGWMYDARDMTALIAALRRVLSLAPEERRAAGDAARVTVEKGHNSSGYGEAYRKLIATAVASG